MVTLTEYTMRSSIYVAPLQIQRERTREESSSDSQNTNKDSISKLQVTSLGYQAQMTPPATPNGSQDDLEQQMESSQPIFHNFLRAFYPFNPAYSSTDLTVTLPLNEGDLVLVHSIHTNGWADGTLLISGARGWLPTNYCEPYDPESMRTLLNALLNFFDLLRSGHTTDSELFGNQEFMRGLIAGVRSLLERSNCLTREASHVKSNDMVRRTRKALLSDLSSLVKTAKRLQELTNPPSEAQPIDVNDLIDEMVLKAFKIVTRGVRFLDVVEADVRLRQTPNMIMPTVTEESCIPPTPPADSVTFDHALPSADATSRRNSNCLAPGSTEQLGGELQTQRLSYKRMSSAYACPHDSSVTLSAVPGRLSVAHRVSTAGLALSTQPLNLVSERLNVCHDILLSYLGSFIGRLHLQSASSAELRINIGQSISAGRSLLSIVELVCSHDARSQDSLYAAKDTMYHCINSLILVARECIRPSTADEYDVMMPEESLRLTDAATDCVVAAGECVANTRFVVERIGDFELDPDHIKGMGLDSSLLQNAPTGRGAPKESSRYAELPLPAPASASPTITIQEKPLPRVPIEEIDLSEKKSNTALDLSSESQTTGPPTLTSRSSAASLLPPLPKFTSPIVLQEEMKQPEQHSDHDGDFHSSFRSDMTMSTTDTNCTSFSNLRDSETSLMSRTSTRATTPDTVPFVPSHQSSFSDLSMSGSQATYPDDDVESRILEKTYAHELLHNKEGQVTGGTIRALVERLTPNHSIPDAMFVQTFYLTFRLFVTPLEFAQALIERFGYAAEGYEVAGLARLRVFNIFKGWLESHWRSASDGEALLVIEAFGYGELTRALPAEARRLLVLTRKVAASEGPLVPRLVSLMGKTTTSAAQYISPDTPLPASIITKSQANALKNWKMGGTSPSILDFDPLELARQFTIKGMGIFCCISPEELLASEWTKKSGSNAVNVRAMSTLATDISNFVTDTILQHEDAKKRAVILKHWIKVAQKCLELNNYDSLMAIICSLNSSGIQRLKKTWDVVSQKRKDMLKVLQDIVEPNKNQMVLRQRIHDHVPPCLPFVGTYLTDLYFVDHGNPATRQLPGIGNGSGTTVINFDKHTKTAKIIGELQRFQIPYRLNEVPELQEWIQAQIIRVRSSNDSNTVHQYYRKSLLLEPRITNSQRPSPIEPQGSFSQPKEKFDFFAWGHSKDKSL